MVSMKKLDRQTQAEIDTNIINSTISIFVNYTKITTKRTHTPHVSIL